MAMVVKRTTVHQERKVDVMTLDSCCLCYVLVSGFVLFDFHVFASCLVSYV